VLARTLSHLFQKIRGKALAIYQSREKNQVVDFATGLLVHSEGSSYIDAISGMFNLPFGYSYQPLKNAISVQMEVLPFHPKENFYTQDIVVISDQLLRLCKMENGATLFLNGGSEAVEASLATALKFHIAKGNPSKRKILSRRHSYHGATLGAHSVSGRGGFSELHQGGYDVVAIQPPFNVTHAGIVEQAATLSELEAEMLAVGPESIAAFIFEPTNHLKGMRPCSKEYICGVRQLCDRYEILMIVDEIVTGAFRTGKFLNTHKFGVVPDIVVLGKGISGGYVPASVMVTSSYVSDAFEGTGLWKECAYSHTYAANPVSLAAMKESLKQLEILSNDGTIDSLTDQLAKISFKFAHHPGVARSESNGLLLGISLKPKLGCQSGKKIERICFERGVIIRGEEDWVCMAPSYITTTDELEMIAAEINNAIIELQNAPCK